MKMDAHMRVARVGDTRAEIVDWEAANLNALGRYIGRELRAFGFPYAHGEWVPVNARYSAMASHRYAVAAVRYASVPTDAAYRKARRENATEV